MEKQYCVTKTLNVERDCPSFLCSGTVPASGIERMVHRDGRDERDVRILSSAIVLGVTGPF